MPLPTGDLLRVSLGGAVPGDQWSISWWFLMTGLGSTPGPSAMNNAAAALLGGFNTLVWSAASNNWKGLCSSGTTLANSKAYLYQAGALAASGAATITPVAGTGANPNPNYCARCITLATNSPGRSRRGRFYMPATAAPVSATTGLFPSISGHLANMASLLSTSSGAQSAGYFFGGSDVADLVVVSSTHGYTTSVTNLRADNKPDTQHGRLDKLVATITDTQAVP